LSRSLTRPKALLKSQEGTLVALDSSFKVELQFFLDMLGEGGAKKLEDQLLSILPTSTKGVEVESAMKAAKALTQSSLFKFCGASTQGSVKAALGMIGSLEQGRRPVVGRDAPAFILKVAQRLQYFVRTQDNDGKAATGHAALMLLLENAKAKGDKITMEDVHVLNMHGYILDARSQKVVHELSKVAVGALTEEPEGAPAKRAAKPSGAAAKKRKKDEASSSKNDAEDEAAALFTN